MVEGITTKQANMISGANTGFILRLRKSLGFTLSAGWKSCLIWVLFSGVFLLSHPLDYAFKGMVEVLLNCFLVALSPALFCLYEGWQLSQDLLVAHNSSLGQVFYKHALVAAVPTVLYILKVGDDLRREALEKSQKRISVAADEELDFKTEEKPFWQPFMQELVLLSLIFVALLPFQTNFLSAPAKLLGNLQLLEQLSIKPQFPNSLFQSIKVYQTYSSLGKHEYAMNGLANLLPYAMFEDERTYSNQATTGVYNSLYNIDPKNELTAEQWRCLVRPFHYQFKSTLSQVANSTSDRPNQTNPKKYILETMAKSLTAAYARHNCINEVVCMALQEQAITDNVNTPFLRTIEYIRRADRVDDTLVAFKIARAQLETQGHDGAANVQEREPAELVCHRFIETLSNRMQSEPRLTKAEHEVAEAEASEGAISEADHASEIAKLQEAEKKAIADGDLAVARDARRELAHIYSQEPMQNWALAQSYFTLVNDMDNAVPSTPGEHLDDLLKTVRACRRNLDMRQAALYQEEVLRTKEKIYGIDEVYLGKARDYATLGQLWQAAREPSKALEAFQKAWAIDKDDKSMPLPAKNVYLSNLLLLTDSAGRPDLVADYKDQLDKNIAIIYNGHPLKQANPITKPHVDPRENIIDPLYWLLLEKDKQLALLE